ncbi:MAG: hypothetical protein WA814_10030 [Candidatus Baltobacteraceae bacterium]
MNDYDKRGTRNMLDPDTTTSLDHLERAIVDWQHKYPRDPWLPRTLAHLMREYWRAGQSSSSTGMAALAVMRTAYPDSPETSAAVAMVYGSNMALSNVSRDATAAPVSEEVAPATYEITADETATAEPAEEAAPADAGTTFDQVSNVSQAPGPDQYAAVDGSAPSDEAAPDDGVPTPPPTR